MRLTDPAATALWSRLQAFELDAPGLTRTISTRIAEENGWTTEHTRRAVEEYRRFLFLTQVAGRPVSPSVAVDAVWHTHLLYSRDYWGRLCGEVLQTPLHHDPNPGGEQENAHHHDQYRHTLDDYTRVFGTAPPADLWPSTVAASALKLENLNDRSRMLSRLLAGGYRPSLLAFLSGGHKRVTDTALAGLHQRQLLSFVAGQPVLGDRVPSDDEGLTPEEWTVWRKLRQLTDAGAQPKAPLGLTYPAVEQEAMDEGLWPTQKAHRLTVWRGVWEWVFLGLVSLLFYFDQGGIAAVLLLGVLWVIYRPNANTGLKPAEHGRRLVEEFTRLVPPSTAVALNSPLLALVVATGAVSLQSVFAPSKSDGAGCGGGGCGGGCGGG